MRLVAVAGIGPGLSRGAVGLSREEAEDMKLSCLIVTMKIGTKESPTAVARGWASGT